MSELHGSELLQRAVEQPPIVIDQRNQSSTVGERGVYVGGDVHGSIVTGNRQTDVPPSIYFHLRILEVPNDGSDPHPDSPDIVQLEPNKQYWLVVSTDANGDSPVVNFVQPSLQITLQLDAEDTIFSEVITIADPFATIPKQLAYTFEHISELTTSFSTVHI